MNKKLFEEVTTAGEQVYQQAIKAGLVSPDAPRYAEPMTSLELEWDNDYDLQRYRSYRCGQCGSIPTPVHHNNQGNHHQDPTWCWNGQDWRHDCGVD